MAKHRELSDEELDKHFFNEFNGNLDNAAYLDNANNADDFAFDGFEDVTETESVGKLSFNFAEYDKKVAEIDMTKTEWADEIIIEQYEEDKKNLDDFINDEELEAGDY